MNTNNNLVIKGIAEPVPSNVNHDRAFRNGWYSDNRKLPGNVTGERDPDGRRQVHLLYLPMLLAIENHLRRRLARFKSATRRIRCGELCAHFLETRSESFNLLLLLCKLGLKVLR